MEIRLYLKMLRRGWWIVALAALMAVNVALVASFLATPQYQSSTRFVISPNTNLVEGRDVINSLEALDKRSIISTYAEFLNSRRIHKETIAALNLSDEIFEEYTITTVVLPEANVIDLTVAGPDPVTAAQLANQIGQRTIDYISVLYGAYDISFLDPAVPADLPFSPQPLRDSALALMLGLVGGATLAILREQIRIPIEAYRQRLRIDSVTGVFNNRYFRRLIEKELTSNPGNIFSLGIVELDGLQELLETMPPTASQHLLRKVTKVLRKELRGNDMVGRWSETSFVVMLPTTASDAAVRTFERIYQSLSQPVDVEQFDITVPLKPRVGGAMYSNDISVQELIERAVVALEQGQRYSDHPVHIWQMKSPFWVEKD